MDWNLEKENLERLILTDKVSYEEIGRMYGCTAVQAQTYEGLLRDLTSA